MPLSISIDLEMVLFLSHSIAPPRTIDKYGSNASEIS
jgi:hypothetical protein